MHIPLIDLKRQTAALKDEIMEELSSAIDGTVFILGDNVRKLEKDFALYTQAEHAIGVANGTDALVLTLEAMGIGPGHEVITSPFTFFATAEAIARVGATPVFVDVDPNTYNIDPALIEAAITAKTKAIMPIHIFGQPADMTRIKNIAERHGLKVIEDACQAVGAEWNGMRAGSMGDAACFSFFPTKNLGGFGDGGMITTKDPELAEKIRMLRFHGQKVKYVNETLGYNSRLDELQAAILNVKFKHLDAWNARRSDIASRYNEAFEGVLLKMPKPDATVKHVYHLYCAEVPEGMRQGLMEHLKEKGVTTAIYYQIPLHLQKALLYLGYKAGDFPVSEQIAQQIFALPLFPELEDEEIEHIINAVQDYFQ